MALDGIFIHHLINELNENLMNSRVESIWSNGDYFVLQTYHRGVRQYLTINLNADFTGCYITKKPVSKGDNTQFTIALKKNLEGALITNITQYRTDRVFIINFSHNDFILGPVVKQLVFEAMGRHSNLYLLSNNIILDAYKRSFILEGRHLVPNAIFEYFQSDKLDANLYEFNALSSPKDITNKYLGISLRLAKYLYNKNIKPLEIILNPTYSIDQNKAYFFNIFEGETISFDTLSESLDNKKQILINSKTTYETFINNQITRINKKHTQLLRQQKIALENLSYKEKADYIYSSGYDLSLRLKSIDDIILDDQKSLTNNAQEFYSLYKKAKRAIDFLETEITTVLSEKDMFILLADELSRADNDEVEDFKEILTPYGLLRNIKKQTHNQKKTKLQLLTIKDDNATYIIGKNARQNAYLINELGRPNDYWFHVQGAPGSHVLVKTDNLDEQVLRKATMLAAHFSSLNLSSSIPVNYTLFKHVSKISGKPASMVKIKNEKTFYIDIIESLISEYLS